MNPAYLQGIGAAILLHCYGQAVYSASLTYFPRLFPGLYDTSPSCAEHLVTTPTEPICMDMVPFRATRITSKKFVASTRLSRLRVLDSVRAACIINGRENAHFACLSLLLYVDRMLCKRVAVSLDESETCPYTLSLP